MKEHSYFWLFCKFMWELYLGFREKRVYSLSQRQSLPEEVQQIFDEDAFVRARAYSSDRVDLLIMKAFYDSILNACFIAFNGIQLFWDKSEALMGLVGISSEALTCCVFVFFVNTFNTLFWLPVELHVYFSLEQKHGFNRLSVGYFAKDKLKVYLLSQLVTLVLAFFAVKIVMTGSDYWYLYLWLFFVLVFLLMNAVYPDYIAPIFDTFSPLPNGELRNKIQTLTESVGYPINRVYILECSQRTEHSDAYHVGFYKSKRIVLFESLLQGYRGQGSSNKGLNNDEVLGVVGHELGHWSLNHILKLASMTLFMCLVMLIIYGPSMKEKLIQKDFRFNDFHPLLGLYVLHTRVAFFSFGVLWASRSFERQADDFAGSIGLSSHLRRALIKVHRDNRIFPVHDWLYSINYLNHPSLLDRLQDLEKYD